MKSLNRRKWIGVMHFYSQLEEKKMNRVYVNQSGPTNNEQLSEYTEKDGHSHLAISL